MAGGRVSCFGAAWGVGRGALARGGGDGAGRETGRDTGALACGGGLDGLGRLTGALICGAGVRTGTGVAGRRVTGVGVESGRPPPRRAGGRVSRPGVTRTSGLVGVRVRGEPGRLTGVVVDGRSIRGRTGAGVPSPRLAGPPTRPGSLRRSTRRSPGRRSGCGDTEPGRDGGVTAAGVAGGVPRSAGGRLPTWGASPRRPSWPAPPRPVRSPRRPSRSCRSHRSCPVLPTGRIEEMLSLRRRPFSRSTDASMIWQRP